MRAFVRRCDGDEFDGGGELCRPFARRAPVCATVAEIEACGNKCVDRNQRKQNEHRNLPANAIEKEGADEPHAGSTVGVNR